MIKISPLLEQFPKGIAPHTPGRVGQLGQELLKSAEITDEY